METTRNLSLYAVPVAYFLAAAPHTYALTLMGKRFDNTQPRGMMEKIKSDQTLDEKTKQRIQRAEAAQSNGFENLGIFAAAVVAGNVAGLDAATLNWLSGSYLVSRVLYNILYVSHETNVGATARSATFTAGVGFIMALFIKAGNAVNATRKFL